MELWDSVVAYINVKITKNLSARNPYLRYSRINYDLDSEEELDELNGENVDSGTSDKEESDVSSLVADGFIVADDYFSDSELSD